MSAGPSTQRRSTRLSTRAPSPPPRPSSTLSQTASPCSSSDTAADAACSESEDDDDGGVFLGAHDPVELQLLAKLSLHSPSVHSSAASEESRRVSRIIRVRKRDSREFLRRKTLSVSQRENDEEGERSSPEKVKASPKRASMTPRSAAIRSEPTTEVILSPPTLDSRSPLQPLPNLEGSPTRMNYAGDAIDLSESLSSLQLLPCNSGRQPETVIEDGSEEAGSTEQDQDEYGSDDDDYLSEDSDKENAPPPSPTSMRSASHDKSFETEKQVFSIGLDDKAVIEVLTAAPDKDTATHLDMGGANASDFSDPEDGGRALRSPSKLSDDGLPPSPPRVDLELFSPKGVTMAHQDDSDVVEPTSSAVDIPTSDFQRSPLSAACSGAPVQSLETSLQELSILDSDAVASSGLGSSTSTLSSGIDSPLPINRAGPVIIPRIASHLGSIRAESGSPFRSLPESPPILTAQLDIGLYHDDLEAAAQPYELASPPSSPKEQVLATSRLLPLPSVPASTLSSHHATPASSNLAYPSDLGIGASRTTKLLKASHPILKFKSSASALGQKQRVVSDSAARDPTTVARTLAVRSQLDAAYTSYTSTSKLSQFGPPQRSASTSSASSTSAPTRKPALPARSQITSSAKASGTAKALPTQVFRSAPSASVRVVRPTIPTATGQAKPVPRPAPLPSTRPIFAAPASRPVQVPSSKPINTLNAVSRPGATARPAVSGGKPKIRAAVGGSTFNKPRVAPLSVRPLISTLNQQVKEGSTSPVPANPLKRPVSDSQAAILRPPVAVGTENAAPRTILGLPSRINRDGTATVGSGGAFGEYGQFGGPPVRPVGGSSFRSPVRTAGPRRLFTDGPSATPMSARKVIVGTPSRGLGTPSRLKVVGQAQLSTAPTSGPVAAVLAEAGSRSGRSLDGSHANRGEAKDDAAGVPQRGSSEDHEEVSFALQRSSETPSSPTSTDAGRTPRVGDKVRRARFGSPPPEYTASSSSMIKGKRALKPPSAITPGARGRQPPLPVTGTTASNMSQKELNAATQLNTMRNQVYLCAIDRQIIRKTGPRPPSPTSKIRTTADREEAEKKAGRSARAKRRAKGSGEEDEDEEDDVPAMERIEQTRMPGDEEDWVTPARPAKRAKLGHADGMGRADKSVRWDKGLVVIRDDGTRAPLSRAASESDVPRGALRQDIELPLDALGNLMDAERPKEALRRTKITVTAVFYDGEEPVPGVPIYSRPEALGTAPMPATNSVKGKKK